MPRRRLSWTVLGALVAAMMAFGPTMATAQYYGGPVDRGGGWRDGGGYARDGYAERGDPRDGYRDRRGYPRGYDRRRCRDGAGGTIIGAIAGGLLGNAVAGYGNRAAGTIIGGGAGALAGREIGRGC